ncbi:MAG: hypothetical protein HFI55_14980 [Lachnospiraceae bacterium]|jgi:hypothetical protein|nr:hypothetical protein [Lachnospiraceae bacterium]
MTRKQAVLQAISKLSNNPENSDIVKKLNELLIDLPCTTWTRESILDAIENYTIEHNNILPNATELIAQNKLPSNTVITNLFGETSMRSFIDKYFGTYMVQYKLQSPYQKYTKEDFINIFIKNYNRIKNKFHVKTVKVKMYNECKEEGSPHSCTIIKHCECKSYNELLVLCGFKEPDKKLEVSVHISYNDTDNSNEELEKLFNSFRKE